MTYTINRFDSTKLVDVEDGTTNNAYTPITLIGRNVASYGEIQNENFLYLLENFASSSQPTKKLSGMIWYDSGVKKLKFWDGSYFRTTGGAEVSSTQPSASSPPIVQQQGDFWYNTSSKQLYVYDPNFTNNSGYVLVGPQGVVGAAQTNLESVSLTDTNNNKHPVVKATANGNVVFVISSDNAFQIDSAVNSISGFTHIYPGITLINSDSGSTNTSYRFYGTATDSDKLGGASSSAYMLKNNPDFSTAGISGKFPDVGFAVGTNGEIKVFMDTVANTDDPRYTANPSAYPTGRLATIANTYSNSLFFRTTDGIYTRTPLILKNQQVTPGADQTYDLGTAGLRWNTIYGVNIYADNFHGTITGTVSGIADSSKKLLVDSGVSDPAWSSGTVATHYRSATTTTKPGYSVVARDANGDLWGNVYHGTATAAQYADLAERYEADRFYEPGTVLIFGGDKEVTTTSTISDTRVAGVVSTAPAYLMNSEAGDDVSFPAVALRGKIPVKVSGVVKKGDVLVSSFIPGYAEVAANQLTVPAAAIIGKSLENKDDPGTGVIMMVV